MANGPQGVESYASAVVFYSDEFGYRWGCEEYLFAGIGHFLIGLQGKSLVLFWPMADTLANKTGLADALSVMQQMPAGKASALVKNAQWVALEAFMFVCLFKGVSP